MAITLPTATRDAKVNAAVDRVDVGTTNATGKCRIYSGTKPAPNDAPTGTLLAEVDLANPAFGGSSAGVATLLGVPLEVNGAASGVAGWFRIVNRDVASVFDGTVGTSGADMIVNTTTVTSGVPFRITGGTYTQPDGT